MLEFRLSGGREFDCGIPSGILKLSDRLSRSDNRDSVARTDQSDDLLLALGSSSSRSSCSMLGSSVFRRAGSDWPS